MSVSRRQALQIGGVGVIGAMGLAVPLSSVDAKSASLLDPKNMPRLYQRTLPIPPVLAPKSTTIGADGKKTHLYQIEQTAAMANIVVGLSTPILGYNGLFPGPTIKVNQGERITLEMDNVLPLFHPQWGYRLDTSTHLHGSASLPQFDGYANDITGRGLCKDYEYPNFQPARTLWYHDHAVHNTAQSVYSGLAGQYHLHDEVERNLLPQGKFDVPLTISDAMFAANGSLGYNDNTHSGLWGDVILVNGRAVAGDEGPAPHLPLPHPQCLHLPVLPFPAEHRRPGHHGCYRRRTDAGRPAGDLLAAGRRRTLRDPH